MDRVSYSNLHDYCRICLEQLDDCSSCGSSKYNLRTNSKLAGQLLLLLSIDVAQESNEYPNEVCKKCYKKVTAIKVLRQLAKNTNVKLQHITCKKPAVKLEISDPSDDDDQLLLPELLEIKVESEPIHDGSSNDLDNGEHHTTFANIKMESTFEQLNSNAMSSILPQLQNQNVNTNDSNDNVDNDEEEEGESDNMLKDENETTNSSFHEESIDMELKKYNDDNEDSNPIIVSANGYGNGMVPFRRSLTCEDCGKVAYKRVYLEAHKRQIHEGYDKPFLCTYCTDSFKRYSHLLDHTRKKHPESPEARDGITEYFCDLCERKYSSRRTLEQHQKRHAQIKQYVCVHCGVGKVTRTELTVHLRSHDSSQKFKCPDCPQLFKHKNAISRHIRVVHHGERRFRCSICNKGFGTLNSQKRHEKLHGGERPYHCDICKKGFINQESVNTHMRAHDKSTWRFKCSYCAKPCISKKNLIDHEQRHKGTKPHICDLCFKGFINESDLVTHKHLGHPIMQIQI